MKSITFVEWLNSEMKKNKLSQHNLGNKLDVSQTTISNWCRGNDVPTSDHRELLSNIFGISIKELNTMIDGESHKLKLNGKGERIMLAACGIAFWSFSITDYSVFREFPVLSGVLLVTFLLLVHVIVERTTPWFSKTRISRLMAKWIDTLFEEV